MRTFIAAIVALAAVAAAVWVVVDLLRPRLDDPTAGTSPQTQARAAATDFASAWSVGDVDAMTATVHPDDRAGLDDFRTASHQMVTALGVEQLELDVDAVGEGGQRREAEATVTITVAVTPPPTSDVSPSAPTSSASPGGESDDNGTTAAATPASTPGTTPAQDGQATAQENGVTETVQISWPTQISLVERQAGWFVVPSTQLLHPSIRRDTLFARTATDPIRASILDINGEPLTSHDDLVTLGIVPGQISDQTQLETVWGEVLPNSQPDLVEVLAGGSLVADWYYPVVSVSREEADRVWPRLRTTPGVTRRDFDGTTTGSTFGSHVLGQVAPPTAEQVEQLGVAVGIPTGVSGLELTLNDQLAGSSRTSIKIIGDNGQVVEPVYEFQSSGAGPVATSLDVDVQRAIESALLGVSDRVAIVAVRSDGGIAASASRPVQGFNRAFEGQYAPGDAIMPMTAISLIEAGSSLDTAVECPATAVVAGAAMEAPRDLGLVDLRTAIASGCDTSVALQVRDLAPDMTSTALALGFEQELQLSLATTTPTWVEPIDVTEAVRTGVGQGRVLATPLLMATMAAEAIAQADLTPWLLQEEVVAAGELPIDMDPMRAVLQAGLAPGGSGQGLLPASTSNDPSTPEPTPQPSQSAPTGTPAATASETDAEATPDEVNVSTPTLVGAVAGTGSSTGSGEIHSWALAAVGDLGIAIVVEDSGGSMELANVLLQRVDRELVELRN